MLVFLKITRYGRINHMEKDEFFTYNDFFYYSTILSSVWTLFWFDFKIK